MVFDRPVRMLSPANLIAILVFLEQNPEAKHFIQDNMLPFLHPGLAPRGMEEADMDWGQLLEERRKTGECK